MDKASYRGGLADLKTKSIEMRLFLSRRRSSFHSAEVLAALDEMTMSASTKQFGERYFEEERSREFHNRFDYNMSGSNTLVHEKMHNLCKMYNDKQYNSLKERSNRLSERVRLPYGAYK